MGTLRINYEKKIIRNGGVVCHLEDFVVDVNHWSKGLGKILINYVLEWAKINNCYKIVGICSQEMSSYYQN